MARDKKYINGAKVISMILADKSMDEWGYTGDVNPAYGGVYYRLDKYGYIEYIEVIEWTEVGPEILIEKGTAYFDNLEHAAGALECCGLDANEILDLWDGTEESIGNVAGAYVYAAIGYGNVDRDFGSEFIVTDPTWNDSVKGKDFKVVSSEDLDGYIRAVYLDERPEIPDEDPHGFAPRRKAAEAFRQFADLRRAYARAKENGTAGEFLAPRKPCPKALQRYSRGLPPIP